MKTETVVTIRELEHLNGMVCWRVEINGEIFYEECHSRKSHSRKSDSKLEAFVDWLAGNGKRKDAYQIDTVKKMKVTQRLPENINANHIVEKIASIINEAKSSSKSVQTET